MENANLKELVALDLDGSDNLTEDTLFNFISKYGPQMQGNVVQLLGLIITLLILIKISLRPKSYIILTFPHF